MNMPLLVIDIAFSYLVWYFFIPLYKRTGNGPLLITGLLGAVLVAFILRAFLWFQIRSVQFEEVEKIWLNSWFMLLNFLNEGCIMRCGLFLCCAMLRNYYSKSQEKAALLQENATAELQLLKAQVHPHFLFNTLNNIYSFSLRKSPIAASLVSKLSDTLQYMITECEAPLVPLNKEIKLLRDYIGLESVRYGERLRVDIGIQGKTNDKMVAPLLLIPLVENSFKHGTSQVIDKAWIDLRIAVVQNTLMVTLRNSKPDLPAMAERKSGIGLRNVQKRLHLLYPGQHNLRVNDRSDYFEVFISLPLLHQTTSTYDNR
jgi:hypothetical protein